MTNLLPDLTAEQFAELKDSIKERGVLVPVVYDSNGIVVDGFHRIRACRELGISDWPNVTVEVQNDAQRAALALAFNLYRRHVSDVQRKKLVAKLRAEGMSVRAIAAIAGVSKSQVSNDWTTASEEAPPVVVGLDGKTYPPRVTKAEREERRREVARRRKQGQSVKSIASDLGISEKVVVMDSKHAGEPLPRQRKAPKKKILSGLQQAAVGVESLAEALDAGHFGDWSVLWDDPEAQVWFEIIDRSHLLLEARIKRALRDWRTGRGKAS